MTVFGSASLVKGAKFCFCWAPGSSATVNFAGQSTQTTKNNAMMTSSFSAFNVGQHPTGSAGLGQHPHHMMPASVACKLHVCPFLFVVFFLLVSVLRMLENLPKFLFSVNF